MFNSGDNFFAICFAIFAAGLLIISATSNPLQTKAPKDSEKSAQEVCGNAGWEISKDDKILTCIPRHGRSYNIKISVNFR